MGGATSLLLLHPLYYPQSSVQEVWFFGHFLLKSIVGVVVSHKTQTFLLFFFLNEIFYCTIKLFKVLVLTGSDMPK